MNMGNLTRSLSAETEALREAYAALNRNGIPATLKALDTQIERIEPPEYPSGGTYRDHAEIVVFLHVRVRLKDHTEWIEGRLADVFAFRNGKAIQWRTFDDRKDALVWAGVKASDAN
jgi:uncharacterized protein